MKIKESKTKRPALKKIRRLKAKLKKFSIRQTIADIYSEEKPIFFDGLDGAILGIDEETYRVIYSVKKAIQIIYKDTPLKKSDLTKEEIEEGVTVTERRMEMTIDHFEFNVRGTKGAGMPIWCDDDF